MSDEKIVTHDDIMEFVGEVFVNNECPWCKSRHWSAESARQEEKVITEIKSPILSRQYELENFLFICLTCGFSRLHAKEAVKVWKEKKSIEKRTIWVNAYDDDRENHFETDVLIDDIKSMQSYQIFATVSPVRCVIELKNGEEIHAIESLEEIKQKIEAREKFYAR